LLVACSDAVNATLELQVKHSNKRIVTVEGFIAFDSEKCVLVSYDE
jgi:hypothetical protein